MSRIASRKPNRRQSTIFERSRPSRGDDDCPLFESATDSNRSRVTLCEPATNDSSQSRNAGQHPGTNGRLPTIIRDLPATRRHQASRACAEPDAGRSRGRLPVTRGTAQDRGVAHRLRCLRITVSSPPSQHRVHWRAGTRTSPAHEPVERQGLRACKPMFTNSRPGHKESSTRGRCAAGVSRFGRCRARLRADALGLHAVSGRGVDEQCRGWTPGRLTRRSP